MKQMRQDERVKNRRRQTEGPLPGGLGRLTRLQAAHESHHTPASLGYHMPAEWEPHEATWIGWPHNRGDWPGKFAPIPWVYAEIVRKIAPGEMVRILVDSEACQERAAGVLKRAGVDLERVEFFLLPTDRGWTRDFGPMFVRHDARLTPAPDGGGSGETAIVRFRFNGWAKYPNWRKDNAIPGSVAPLLRARDRRPVRIFQARVNGREFVLEGGSIEVNGQGTLLTTEECLLDTHTQARNPGLSQAQVETALREYLGVTHVLWLGRGIAGDDTHGHVDDLCRFVAPGTVVLCREDRPSDPNYLALNENWERLAGMRLEDGSRVEAVALPMPDPLYFEGQRLPASYANFYIANSAVLVPTFNDPKDREAIGILAELITDRPVIGIHAVDLAWGLGTLHCLTQQQPLGEGLLQID
jgi:agmatine deiminase